MYMNVYKNKRTRTQHGENLIVVSNRWTLIAKATEDFRAIKTKLFPAVRTIVAKCLTSGTAVSGRVRRLSGLLTSRISGHASIGTAYSEREMSQLSVPIASLTSIALRFVRCTFGSVRFGWYLRLLCYGRYFVRLNSLEYFVLN